MHSTDKLLPIGVCVTLACQFECLAAKPGNVHRGADFDDLSLAEFLTSAAVITPWMETALHRPVGETILEAVKASRAATGTNANLGIVLLLAPLAAVPPAIPIRAGIQRVLADLTPVDARHVYQAIRLAQPGGLGRSAQADVAGEPPTDLIAAMRLAEDRDLVARQYARGFREVLERVVPWLVSPSRLPEVVSQAGEASAPQRGAAKPAPQILSRAIVDAHLRLMSEYPDTLILRKSGPQVAREAADRAAAVLSSAGSGDEAYERALADFDFWLRSDGRRRNPGTTADLIAAGLFVALREGLLQPPFQFYAR